MTIVLAMTPVRLLRYLQVACGILVDAPASSDFKAGCMLFIHPDYAKTPSCIH